MELDLPLTGLTTMAVTRCKIDEEIKKLEEIKNKITLINQLENLIIKERMNITMLQSQITI